MTQSHHGDRTLIGMSGRSCVSANKPADQQQEKSAELGELPSEADPTTMRGSHNESESLLSAAAKAELYDPPIHSDEEFPIEYPRNSDSTFRIGRSEDDHDSFEDSEKWIPSQSTMAACSERPPMMYEQDSHDTFETREQYDRELAYNCPRPDAERAMTLAGISSVALVENGSQTDFMLDEDEGSNEQSYAMDMGEVARAESPGKRLRCVSRLS